MNWAALIIAVWIAVVLTGIGSSLHRLATHHERWPAPEPDEPPATDPSQTP